MRSLELLEHENVRMKTTLSDIIGVIDTAKYFEYETPEKYMEQIRKMILDTSDYLDELNGIKKHSGG